MSRSLSVATVLEKNLLAGNAPFLVAIDAQVIDPVTGNLVEHLRFVNNSADVTWQGNLYSAMVFDIALKQAAGEQPQITLSITDLTGVVQQRMQAYGGGVGFPVDVYVFNAGNLSQAPEVKESFMVIGSASADYVVTFTLGAESALSKPFPRRRQMRDFCAWGYKDGNCQYTGSLPTCDMSLTGSNGCSAHSNVIHFGGYPGITGGARYG